MGQGKDNKLISQPVGPLLFKLASPMILAELITILYNMVDRIYIGHMPNSSFAMAGIGLCAPIVTIITAFAQLFGRGGAPLSSIRMGEGNIKEAERIMGNSFCLLLASSVLVTIVAHTCAEPLLRLFGASDNTIPYALQYMKIYSLGTVFVELSVGLNFYINTQGFTGVGMGTMVIGAVLNIILDPLFIFQFNMGVRGAALATVIAQSVSCIWILGFLFSKKTLLRIRFRYMRLRLNIVRRILSLGITPFFQATTESAVNICFNTQLRFFGGDLAVSSLTIITSLYQIVNLPMTGIAQGAQPIISYCYGADRHERVKKAMHLVTVSNMVFGFISTLTMMLFPTPFIRIFTTDGALISMTAELMPIYIAGGLVYGLFAACQQGYVSLGKGFYAFSFAFIRKIILLIPMLYIFPAILPWGAAAVMLAEPVSDSLVSIANGIYFRFFSKKKLAGHHD